MGLEHQVILCKHGKIDENRFLDPRASQAFVVDHIRQVRRHSRRFASISAW